MTTPNILPSFRAPLRGPALLAALALSCAAALPAGTASAQGATQLYSFHTGAASGCPGLDWHVVVGPDRKVSGMVGWDGMTRTATLSGTLAANGEFTATASEAATGKKATVGGRAAGNALAIAISGTGSPCDNVVLNVPRAVGGLGGGGG